MLACQRYLLVRRKEQVPLFVGELDLVACTCQPTDLAAVDQVGGRECQTAGRRAFRFKITDLVAVRPFATTPMVKSGALLQIPYNCPPITSTN